MHWFVLITVLTCQLVCIVVSENAFPSIAELSALEDLYYATDGPYWSYGAQYGILWTFNESSPFANPCGETAWYGVTCINDSTTSFVQILDLSYSDLYGTLPDTIGNFSQLTVLVLSLNVVYGYLPESLGNLGNLTRIDIDNCYFWGDLPDSLARWDKVVDFYVYDNLLSGTIPDYLGQWKNMLSIDLSINIFTGSIPSSLGNTSSITFLNMGDNPLNGSLPSSLGALTGLTDFIVYDTDIGGSLPESFSRWTQMSYFYAYSNAFTGSIPASLSSWTKIIYFLVEDNLLTSSLPDSFSSWSSIDSMFIDDNRLTGTLPASYSCWTKIVYFDAFSNQFVGTIPDSYSRWGPTLLHFYVYDNQLNGTIPSSIGNWSNLIFFYAQLNQITGTIPSSLASWTKLEMFSIDYNQISGSLLPELGNWTSVTEIFVDDNLLTGSLPASFANMKQIELMFLEHNYLQGSIPPEWCQLKNLINIDAYHNSLSGSLPSCLGNCSSMETLWLVSNDITGSIPDSVDGMYYLSVLMLELNLFTSSIPEALYDCTYLNSIDFSSNHFTGSISNTVFQLAAMNEFYLDANVFSGTIPTGVSQMSKLLDLVLNNNQFSGSLEGVFNSTVQVELSSVNLNENSLTGSVPDEVFLLPQLLTLSLSSNCLSASLSSVMCSGQHLTGLVLDGIGTAPACRKSFFPGIPGSTSYMEDSQLKVTGHIPACLFEMDSLHTLHLSGNAIKGSIPNVDSIAAGLSDLTISHNSLSGTIPAVLQQRTWTSFDVSFNRLSGILDSHFNSSTTENSNHSVGLRVNRLSGGIPSALTDAVKIHLVDGNMFSCGLVDRSALPASDPAANNYQCGSNILDLAMYLFGGMLLAIIVGCVILIRWNKDLIENVREVYGACTHSEIPTIMIFNQDLRRLIQFAAIVVLILVVIVLPIYAGLNTRYSTYTMKYAWAVSAAYLSGVTPGAVLLCVFLILIAVVSALTRKWPVLIEEDRRILFLGSFRSVQARTIGIFLLNLLVVLGINIFYVYVLQKSQSQFVSFLAAVCVALFKLVWAEQCLPTLFRSVNATIVHRTCAQLFNFFVIPLSVLAVISPNCFYYAVANSEPVSASVDFLVCQFFAPNGSCLSFETEPIYSTYTPPFVYNYQCSSTFISDYSSVYVYMYIISGLVLPIVFSLIQYLSSTSQPGCMRLLPNVHKPPSHSVIDQPNVIILNRDLVLIRLVTALSLLLTLGVVVPLVSIVVLVYLVSSLLFIQMSLGRLLEQSDKDLQNKYEAVLSRECVHILTSIHSVLWIVVLFACVFYAIVLWDIVGDDVGLVSALWAPLLMVLIPAIYYLAVYSVGRWRKKEEVGDKDMEMAVSKSGTRTLEEVDNPIA